MAKPRRKHPALASMEESPQGIEFLEVIRAHLGAGVRYTPLASFDRGRRHLFVLESSVGTALLSEAWEQPEGPETRPRWALSAILEDGRELCATLEAWRWSAGQEQAITGTDPFPGVSARERRQLEAERRREIAAAKDLLEVHAGDPGTVWNDLSGIPRAAVEAELERHGIRIRTHGEERRTLVGALGLPPPIPCPVCGFDALPIVFGLPADPLFRAAKLGLVVLGGCVIDHDPPAFECPHCGVSVWRDGHHKPAGWYSDQLYRSRPEDRPGPRSEVWFEHSDGARGLLEVGDSELGEGGEAQLPPGRQAWSDGFDGPQNGEFAHFHKVLTADSVPAPDAPWFPDLCDFALSFDGYEALGGFGPVADLANGVSDRWHRTRELPDSLVELRACLFFEQRRQRHLDQPLSEFAPEGTWLAYVRALVEAIRSRAQTGTF